MNDGKKRRSSAELSAHKRFEKSRSRWKGYPAKPWLCGERTSDEVTEPCCLRRGEGYAIREDESIVPEHKFCVLRGLGQRPNKHETGGSRVDGIRLFSQSGYRFALLAAFLPPVRTPVFPPLPILQSGRGVLVSFGRFFQKTSILSVTFL